MNMYSILCLLWLQKPDKYRLYMYVPDSHSSQQVDDVFYLTIEKI